MMLRGMLIVLVVPLFLVGCPGEQINPFQTVTDQFGNQANRSDGRGGGGGGGASQAAFRRAMTVTINNNNANGDLELSFVAWVNTSSVRSGDQQDVLIASGFQQITREIRLGSAITLPVGTYVLAGEGTAGAIPIFLRRTSAGGPPAAQLSLVTPDAMLLFLEPPDSCESVAFEFTLDGFQAEAVPVPGSAGELFQSSSGAGNRKTLSQFNVYQCDPLRPGLFLRTGGAKQSENEYFEGESVIVDFNAVPDADGNFAIVTYQ